MLSATDSLLPGQHRTPPDGLYLVPAKPMSWACIFSASALTCINLRAGLHGFSFLLDPPGMLERMNAPSMPLSAVPKPMAPMWHTVLFLFGLAALAASSVWFHGLARFGFSSRVPSYFLTMAAEWLLVGWVAWGVRLGGSSVSSLIGEKWTRVSDFFRDLGLSVAFFIASASILMLVTRALHAAPNENIRNLLPSSLPEKAVWVLVAVTAGFCEELMTRGYLQKQLSGLLKNNTASVLAQGIIFGAAHAYQGWKYMVPIALLGCMLGWLAQWRRSLLPGMLAHSIQDMIGGLAR
jgi:uncharacterized protein